MYTSNTITLQYTVNKVIYLTAAQHTFLQKIFTFMDNFRHSISILKYFYYHLIA